jgi:TIR domain-containing protein/pentapeptide repeat protein
MANEEQLATLLLGVSVWNEWREKEADLQPDLSGIVLPEADLAMVNLGGANLRGADLHGADLSGGSLSGSDLGEANLRGTILHGADLNWSYLSGADLREADLGGALLGDANLCDASLAKADLSGADLHGADLRATDLFGACIAEANFDETILAYTKFGNVDLSAAKGLTNVKHAAASTIGVDTIYRSKGDIPEAFLRGAGIPENFISFINSKARQREPTYSCFICHSFKDKRFCDRLHADLQAQGVRTWYFPEDAPRGKRFFAEIVYRVKMFDKVIVVCSKHALESKPVVKEIVETLKREYEERGEFLFPVRLDNYLLKEWQHRQKAVVIEKVVADFRGWNRSAVKYEDGLKNLLRALKSSSH